MKLRRLNLLIELLKSLESILAEGLSLQDALKVLPSMLSHRAKPFAYYLNKHSEEGFFKCFKALLAKHLALPIGSTVKLPQLQLYFKDCLLLYESRKDSIQLVIQKSRYPLILIVFALAIGISIRYMFLPQLSLIAPHASSLTKPLTWVLATCFCIVLLVFFYVCYCIYDMLRLKSFDVFLWKLMTFTKQGFSLKDILLLDDSPKNRQVSKKIISDIRKGLATETVLFNYFYLTESEKILFKKALHQPDSSELFEHLFTHRLTQKKARLGQSMAYLQPVLMTVVSINILAISFVMYWPIITMLENMS